MAEFLLEVTSVDLKEAEDVRGGGGRPHHVEPEEAACDGLDLRAFLQAQESRYLAGLEEVGGLGAGRRSGPIALHALELLHLLAVRRHHVQLDVLGLVLVEQYLTVEEEDPVFQHSEGARVDVVLHCLAHIQRLALYPSFYHATVSH